MESHTDDRAASAPAAALNERGNTPGPEEADWRLRRWQVSFRSGTEWFSVGEFVALDAASAIERAVVIFGPADDHQAEEIPWDAAPLPRLKPSATGPMT